MYVPSMGFTFASAGRMRRLHEAAHNHRGDGAQRDVEGHRLRRHGRTRFRGNLGLLGVHATGGIGFNLAFSSHLGIIGRHCESPRERERYSHSHLDADAYPDAYPDARPGVRPADHRCAGHRCAATGGGGTAGLQDATLFIIGGAAIVAGAGGIAYRRRAARNR